MFILFTAGTSFVARSRYSINKCRTGLRKPNGSGLEEERRQSPQCLSRTSITNLRKERASASGTRRVTTLRQGRGLVLRVPGLREALRSASMSHTHSLLVEWAEGRQTQTHTGPWQGNCSQKRVEFSSPPFPVLRKFRALHACPQ